MAERQQTRPRQEDFANGIRLFLTSGFTFKLDSCRVPPGWEPFAVPSDARVLAEMKAAWREHGPQILTDYVRTHPGWRPWGWWQIEHDMEPPDRDLQPAWLRRHGFLTADEEKRLAETRHARDQPERVDAKGRRVVPD